MDTDHDFTEEMLDRCCWSSPPGTSLEELEDQAAAAGLQLQYHAPPKPGGLHVIAFRRHHVALAPWDSTQNKRGLMGQDRAAAIAMAEEWLESYEPITSEAWAAELKAADKDAKKERHGARQEAKRLKKLERKYAGQATL